MDVILWFVNAVAVVLIALSVFNVWAAYSEGQSVLRMVGDFRARYTIEATIGKIMRRWIFICLLSIAWLAAVTFA